MSSGSYDTECSWSITCEQETISGGAPYGATHAMPPGSTPQDDTFSGFTYSERRLHPGATPKSARR